MADIASRAFRDGKFFTAHDNLANYFNSHFPQTSCWHELTIPKEWVSLVISCLRGATLEMGSLRRTKKSGLNTGKHGAAIAAAYASILSSEESHNSKQQLQSRPLLLGSGQEAMDWENKSPFKRLLKQSQPSPRPSNWLENAVPSSQLKGNTQHQSDD